MANQPMNNMNSSVQHPVQPEKQKTRSSSNFKNDPARAVEAGRKGGSMSGGNFKHNPARAAEAGRKGGEASGAARRQQHH